MTTLPAPWFQSGDSQDLEDDSCTAASRLVSGADGSLRSFLAEQVRALGPFDFVLVSPSGSPEAGFEVVREEDGGLRVRLATRSPAALSASQQATLERLGFQVAVRVGVVTRWERRVSSDADRAACVVEEALAEVLACQAGTPLDVHHGSRRAEYEGHRKLEALRVRIEPLLAELLGSVLERNDDGDWMFSYRSTKVFVAPRMTSKGREVVRVFALASAGTPITVQLALFVASINFSMTFCRFSLDLAHGAVWIDDALLGDQVTDEELRFAIGVVAATAAEWGIRIQEMFGGVTAEDLLSGRSEGTVPDAPPGQGGYL